MSLGPQETWTLGVIPMHSLPKRTKRTATVPVKDVARWWLHLGRFASGCPFAKTPGHGQTKREGGQQVCSSDHLKVPGGLWLSSSFPPRLSKGSSPHTGSESTGDNECRGRPPRRELMGPSLPSPRGPQLLRVFSVNPKAYGGGQGP